MLINHIIACFMILQIIDYVFAAMSAFAILYFFYGIANVKYTHDYQKIDKGKDSAFSALAIILIVIVVWIVVHSIVVALQNGGIL